MTRRLSAEVWGAIALLVVVVVMLHVADRARKPARDLEACRENLTQISAATERYSEDHSGRYPLARFAVYGTEAQGSPAVAALGLQLLVPKYLASIPRCPAAGRDTYSLDYVTCGKLDAWFLACRGHHHQSGIDRPRCTSQWGVEAAMVPQDDYAVTCEEVERPPLVGTLDVGTVLLGMSRSQAQAHVGQDSEEKRYVNGEPLTCLAHEDGVAYFDRTGSAVSVSGRRLVFAGATLREGDEHGRVRVILGYPLRVRTIGSALGDTIRWEYAAEGRSLDVDLDPQTKRVRYFVLWRDPAAGGEVP